VVLDREVPGRRFFHAEVVLGLGFYPMAIYSKGTTPGWYPQRDERSGGLAGGTGEAIRRLEGKKLSLKTFD
jgi:hypothetical protein